MGRLREKDIVFGLRTAGGAKAWPITAFEGGRVINDAVGFKEVVLVGDAESRSVRAYQRNGADFAAGADADHLRAGGANGPSPRKPSSAPTARGCRACPVTWPFGSPGPATLALRLPTSRGRTKPRTWRLRSRIRRKQSCLKPALGPGFRDARDTDSDL